MLEHKIKRRRLYGHDNIEFPIAVFLPKKAGQGGLVIRVGETRRVEGFRVKIDWLWRRRDQRLPNHALDNDIAWNERVCAVQNQHAARDVCVSVRANGEPKQTDREGETLALKSRFTNTLHQALLGELDLNIGENITSPHFAATPIFRETFADAQSWFIRCAVGFNIRKFLTRSFEKLPRVASLGDGAAQRE